MAPARSVRVRGVVQGVGFRPFVYRLAAAHGITGWVLNAGDGVHIHAEGSEEALGAFLRELEAHAPPAASIDAVEISPADAGGFADFRIRASEGERDHPTARISPDLPACASCLAELSDPANRRAGYPYINCTDCGPRYSIVLGLPYDRASTTMAGWPMCPRCAGEYHDPADRRFHAQPLACGDCGPRYTFRGGARTASSDAPSGDAPAAAATGDVAITEAARALCAGQIVAIKGLGGYHLVCDAWRADAVRALRERKYRKDRPFALMSKDVETAHAIAHLTPEAEALLTSPARPIVLAPARAELPYVAPGNGDLGVMLPYTPLHHLLFARGAPDLLVATSANRSSEPIAYRDDDALERLRGIADAFLIGERPIARRVDDSVVRAGALGPVVLRRARGYAPRSVARLPTRQPILALGADLKNTITLVVDGEAFVSQHIGDLEFHEAYLAFEETVRDLVAMYGVRWSDLTVVHDLHPQYVTTSFALSLPARVTRAVQHHRAHVASVLAERGALDARAIGVAFDGTGYGDDGAIWGGEFFAGSVLEGFRRVAHLRAAVLPGGDAAARWPVQAAAGFLSGLDHLPDLTAPPFGFPPRYAAARRVVSAGLRTFPTTSAGRLFDVAAAILGFTHEVTYEGQAAIWLEQLARGAGSAEPYPAPFEAGELDFRPALRAAIEDRARGRSDAEVARAFHAGLARGIADAIIALCAAEATGTAVLSGGVFQNELLLGDVASYLRPTVIQLLTNRDVPPNDGGISLGQAALALGADDPVPTSPSDP
ncbi:MAG: carbamoyltransferase HypF [Gemmatimonadaceae bacterium]